MTARVALTICLFTSLSAFGAVETRPQPQLDHERETEAVVRNKTFYKKGHFEIAGTFGTMPYDSAVAHTLFGGRFTWHINDHYGWEVVDAQVASSAIPAFTTELVSGKGLSNLQLTELKTVISTNLLVSPVYGKFRLFGATVMYFDLYGVVGAGFAQTNNLMFSTTNTGGTVTRSTVKSSWDPMITAGIGMKVFFSSAFGMIVDLRDYMTFSEKYGKKSLVNNFQVGVGLCVFLPTF
jgi:outer membrane beta-barrel protein